MIDQIRQIEHDAQAAIGAATTTDALEETRIRFLGRKAELPNLLRGVAQLPPEQRAEVGKAANQARQELEAAVTRRSRALAASELDVRLAEDRVDVTLPADPLPQTGRLHLITQTRRDIEDVFIGLGFNVAEGPEVETAYYNFDALNTPVTHPSRLMTDTFYVKPVDDLFDPETVLLRVHTSPVQVRAMERQPPPIYLVVPGRVYRPDSDATHTPQFHQMEGLAVDTDITLGDLQGTLLTFARAIFGDERECGCARISSRSPSPASRSTCPASTAPTASPLTASGARCARAPPGSRSSAPGWSTPTCSSTCASTATTPRRSRGSRSGWGSSGSRCSATASRTCACSTTTTCASWSSSDDRRRPQPPRPGLMRVPLEWLHEYCRPELDADALGERLAMSGTAVEGIEHHGVAELGHFVVGKVLEAGPTPTPTGSGGAWSTPATVSPRRSSAGPRTSPPVRPLRWPRPARSCPTAPPCARPSCAGWSPTG